MLGISLWKSSLWGSSLSPYVLSSSVQMSLPHPAQAALTFRTSFSFPTVRTHAHVQARYYTEPKHGGYTAEQERRGIS